MLSTTDDTICAIASPPQGALRGIVRISGSETIAIIQKISADKLPALGARSIRLPIEVVLPVAPDRNPLTLRADTLLWPNAASYTGQPAAELHVSGCPPLLDALTERVCQAGARPARPGEFTLRAFLSGRLDLTQAEAVLGVIDADNEQSLRLALRQLAGGLSIPLAELRDQLLQLLAHLEAGLDFVEEDIEFISQTGLTAALTEISQTLRKTKRQVADRTLSAERPLIVLRGAANAGKSSLLNCLAGQQAAIVANLPGTTRDAVEVKANFGQRQVVLTDTAGFESASSPLQHAMQQMAVDLDQRATLRLLCWDGRQPPPCVDDADRKRTICVRTKCDLANTPDGYNVDTWLPTSSVTGQGIQQLRSTIAGKLDQLLDQGAGGVAGTISRCRVSLDQAIDSIDVAIQIAENGFAQELVAAEMRVAVHAVGEVTGEVYTDDILDRIFSRFCIGK